MHNIANTSIGAGRKYITIGSCLSCPEIGLHKNLDLFHSITNRSVTDKITVSKNAEGALHK